MKKEIEYIRNRAQGIARYSNKIRESVKKINNWITPISKEAGIKYTDEDPFFVEKLPEYTKKYYLRITKVEGWWGIWVKETNDLVPEDIEIYNIDTVGRQILKASIKRLPTFLLGYSRVLAKTLESYHDEANKIERVAQATPS